MLSHNAGLNLLKIFLKHALDADSDGWVPADKWDAAKEENTRLFGQWMESSKASGTREDRATDLWPFNEVGPLQTGKTAI